MQRQQLLVWPLAVFLALLSPVQSARQLRSSSRSSSSPSSSSGSSSLPSAWTTGIATNYGGPSEGKDPYTPSYGTSDGSCGYGVLDKTKYPYWSVAALSPSNSFYVAGPTGACGQCFEVQCLNSGGQFAGRCNSDPSQRSVTVMISDVCPECEANHMDIQALTYNKMAPMLGGRIDIQYRRVECTPPSNLQVNIDKNSGTGGFLKMSVSTAGGSGGISSVQVKGGNTGWTGLHNLYGAEWELDTQPQLPLDLHITADSGQELTAFGVIDKSGQTGILPTGVQFSFSGPPSFDEASSIDSGSSSSSSGSSSSSSAGSSSSSSKASPGSSIQQDIATASGQSSGGASASAGGDEVSAFDGPPPSSPGAGSPSGKTASPSSSSPSSSKSPSSSSSSSSSSSTGSCQDVAPGKNSCTQEKSWGHCSSSWMTKASSSSPNGYCAQTCGRC